MRTRSSARNLFPPLENPELTIRRRSRANPILLNDFEMAAEGNGDLPVHDLRTMEELCQPSLNGRGGPIAPIAIQATNFGLKNDMIQQVQNSCQLHGLPGDDANKHLDKFLHVTQSIKVNGVTDDALRLYLFPHSLTHHAIAWFDRLPRNSINTFEQMAKMFLGKYFPPSMVTKLKNEITNFRQCPDQSLFEAWEHYKISIDPCLNHNKLLVTQIDTFYNGLTLKHRDTINAAAGGTFMKRRPEECYDLIENMTTHHNDWDTSAQWSESSSSITSFSFDKKIAALKAEMAKINKNLMRVLQVNQLVKAVTPNCETCGGPYSFNDCPAIVGQTQNFMNMNTASSSGSGNLPSNTITNPKEELKCITTGSGTAYQGPTIPTSSSLPRTESLILNYEPVAAPVSASKPNQRPSIPYPSRLHDQKLRDKANDQREKFFQIFKDLNFNISFADALILMPKTPLNEHCSVVLLKKFLEKLGDPGKFLIPCDFPGMAECLALANLGASINLMPLSMWNKLSLPELTPTLMTLELADRSISQPISFAEDVYVKVRKFHFPADFVVAITFNLDQTSRYSANYNDMTANRIDVIDMACEEYSNSDFLLEKVDAFLSLEDDPTSPKVDQSYVDPEGEILLLEAFLNDDPSLPPANQGNYLPQVRKELKICEAKTDKYSIDEPPEVELKDLPPHLEYAFLEGDYKFPVIIVKDLSVEEKTALITEDYEPAVQHQRRVNPKIHDVIKNEVLKHLDAGLIYPIFDIPWLSPVHCVPKKGGFTVVENEENELILTRLVTGWHVCIDYQKLNEATRKDHFPLPFMDQMLERLARNEYYCFLDGLLDYFQIPIDLKYQEKPHSLVYTERLPTVACLLGYAMHRGRFRGA
nr:reverse transcriptase domain-containing protein [Tanacetum cinerariifolium]